MALSKTANIKGREKILPFSSFPVFIVLIASCYCLLNLFFFFQLPEYGTPLPGSDTAVYWFIGKIGTENNLLFENYKSLFFSPIYGYLFILFSTFGNSVALATILSSFSFITASILIYYISKSIFNDNTTGIISAFLFIFYKPIDIYAILPIKTMFFLVVFLIFIFSFIKKYYLPSGIAAGISILLEGISLPLIVNVLIYSLFKKEINIRSLIFFLLGILICFFPFSLRNLAVGGNFNPLPPISGIHLYIGNNNMATGIYKKIPGIRPNAFGHYFDAKELAEKEEKKKLTDSEVNDFWKRKALTFIKENPEKFIHLYLKKLLLTVNTFEFPNNYNIYVISNFIPTLKLNFLDFSIIFSLGIVGVLLSLKRRNFNLLTLLLIAYPFILSLFFITSRYRLLFAIFLIPYAAYTLKNLRSLIKPSLKVILYPIVIVAAYKISTLPLPQIQNEIMKTTYIRRILLANRLKELERELKSTNNREERKKLLLQEARLFYISGMKEIGNYLRKKALSQIPNQIPSK